MIEGVLFKRLKVYEDERGSIRHMLKRTDDHFTGFGEIYFSTIKPGVVKAWHIHKNMELNYCCVVGAIMVGLVDLRPNSKTFGKKEVYVLTDPSIGQYKILKIPPMVWNGFRSAVDKESIMANCATLAHYPGEIIRRHPDDFPVDFDWGDYEIAG